MDWFLADFAFLLVVLKAVTLAANSIAIGGVIYLLAVALPAGAPAQQAILRSRRLIHWASLALAISGVLYVALESAVLIGTTELAFRGVISAEYFLAGTCALLAALLLFFVTRGTVASPNAPVNLSKLSVPLVFILLAASVSTSHAVSRLDHRVAAGLLTALHQLAVAAWIGGLPFLLLSIPAVQDKECVRNMARRFSAIAITSVATLIAAGIGLSYFYVGSLDALYGTAYGFMIITKSALLLVMLALGALNWWLVRSLGRSAGPSGIPRALLSLERIGEMELGIGFSIILAAASLTSQPPAVDLVQDRLTWPEIVERNHPAVPRFTSPSLDQLSPATPIEEAVRSYDVSAAARAHNQDPDIAWSEFNHHWSGLMILVLGVAAWAAARFPAMRWARVWPLGFVGIATFAFIRSDTENWPLGPVSFWKSFSDPEVALHRVLFFLVAAYGFFEWGVQTGRLRSRKAAYVFPVVMAGAGAALLLHSHALGNIKNELLIEMSHTAFGIFAIIGGWARFVQVRLPESEGGWLHRVAAQVWPLCLVIIGCVLLNYREA
jgi:copper resistance protein D